MNKSNFDFLNDINDKVREDLAALENAAASDLADFAVPAFRALTDFIYDTILAEENLTPDDAYGYYNARHPGNPGTTELNIAIWAAADLKQLPGNVYVYPELRRNGKPRKTKYLAFMRRFIEDYGGDRVYTRRPKYALNGNNILTLLESFHYLLTGYYKFYKMIPQDTPAFDRELSRIDAALRD